MNWHCISYLIKAASRKITEVVGEDIQVLQYKRYATDVGVVNGSPQGHLGRYKKKRRYNYEQTTCRYVVDSTNEKFKKKKRKTTLTPNQNRSLCRFYS